MPSPARSPASRYGALVLSGLALVALAAALTVVLSMTHQQQLAMTRSHTQKLARALEEHSVQAFAAVDDVLHDIAERLGDRLVDPFLSPHEVHSLLLGHAEDRSGIRTIVVLGLDGVVRYDSRWLNPPGIDVYERAFFQDALTSERAVIGNPLITHVPGLFSIPVSRRIESSTGEPLGVVVALLDPDYFSELYRALNLGDNGNVTLIRTDGRVLVRAPHGTRYIGTLLPEEWLRQFRPGPFEGTVQKIAPTDGVERILSYRKLEKYPVVVVVGVAVGDITAEWWDRLVKYVALWLGVAAVVIASAYALAREIGLRERSEATLRSVLDSMTHGVVTLDPDNRLVSWNDRFPEIADIPADYLTPGVSWRELVDNLRADHRWATGPYADLPASDEEQIVSLDDGRTIGIAWCRTREGGAVATVRDVTEQMERERDLAERAQRDALTGLLNRTALEELIDHALLRATRFGRRTGLLFIDLDGFKPINDQHGHAVGDQLLRTVAERLGLVLRTTDVAVRYGGDEFVVLLENLPDPEAAEIVAGKIAEALRAPIVIDGICLSVEASIGTAVAAAGKRDGEALLRAADAAMYEVKRRRKESRGAAADAAV